MTLDRSQAYRGVNVLVLGATGFIGRWVARALTDAGARLLLPARDLAGTDELSRHYGIRGEWIQTDLNDFEAIASLIRHTEPAVVFNLAGYGVDRTEQDESAAYRINRDLVRALAESLSEQQPIPWPGQRLVHVGSGFEYGRVGGDLNESTRPDPGTLYGQSKFAGTQAVTEVCRRTGLRGLTARPFTIYGPGEHPGRLVPSLMEAARVESPIPLTAGLQQRDFTYVEDIAEGLLRLGCSPAEPGAVVNLATGRLTSVHDFTLAAARVLGIPESHLGFGSIPTRKSEMEHDPVSVSLLESLIEWRPATSPEEGIRRTVAFEARRHS